MDEPLPKYSRSTLTRAIKASTGMRIADFAEQKLGLKYHTFITRVRMGGLRIEDLHKICFYTGYKFEFLFPNPLVKRAARPLPLNLDISPSEAIPATTTNAEPVAPRPRKEEHKKGPGSNNPAPASTSGKFEFQLETIDIPLPPERPPVE